MLTGAAVSRRCKQADAVRAAVLQAGEAATTRRPWRSVASQQAAALPGPEEVRAVCARQCRVCSISCASAQAYRVSVSQTQPLARHQARGDI